MVSAPMLKLRGHTMAKYADPTGSTLVGWRMSPLGIFHYRGEQNNSELEHKRGI